MWSLVFTLLVGLIALVYFMSTTKGSKCIKEWVLQQNDPSLKYKETNHDPMLKLKQQHFGISSAKHSEQEIVERMKNNPGLMSRETLERMYQQARSMGRTPPPIKCEHCGSKDKERYCMLRTHFIAYECIDCVIQNALDARY